MSDSPRSALMRIVAFAGLMLVVGRNHWWLCAVVYGVYRISQLEIFQKIWKTLPRDLKGVMLLVKVKRDINRRLKANLPIHEIFLEQVRKHPQKLAAIEVETGRKITYEQINKLMNQYANLFEAEGLQSGDVVSLFMENGIDFFAIWLGLSKIGVVSAFINSNLKLEPLAHSIKVAKSKKIITTESLLATLNTVEEAGLLTKGEQEVLISQGDGQGHRVLADLIKDISTAEPRNHGVNFSNVLCYVYTSGTTGNPKPAIIKHFRYYWMAMGAGNSFGVRPDDVVYITMPLYHSAAGIMGIGTVIVFGTTAVIRKKFSASNFWKDCVKHQCTASQYIGEIARYLLAMKPCPEETQHKVRMMWGNGLRAEIWPQFVQRFGISRIGELYGSTEGNSNIVNIDNHVGSCGFFPIYPMVTSLYPIRLVKVDDQTGELIRDPKTGLCVPCCPGEIGEMVGLIKNKDILLKFEGYVNKSDSDKKVYADVFVKGDRCFASGDILRWDELGYLYFKDRRGDTFRDEVLMNILRSSNRDMLSIDNKQKEYNWEKVGEPTSVWKGENCSTTEVEGILQPLMSIEDATVYGVEVGQMEGRAGMAGVVLKDGVDVDEFLKELSVRVSSNLAAYAIPVFVRLCKTVDRTGTFKLKKLDLQKQGYDLVKCNGDSIYFWNGASKSYVPLDASMQKDIDTGVYTRL